VQSQFADAFIELLGRVRDNVMLPNLCLSGGLFHNTYLNTRVAGAGVFENVFVPVHPGNAGLAVGCALGCPSSPLRHRWSRFWGPSTTPRR
jgi:carbamoyltransferase